MHQQSKKNANFVIAKMHSLKGALTGLTLSLILLASETLAHPTQGYEDSYGKAGFLGLCGVDDNAKNK